MMCHQEGGGCAVRSSDDRLREASEKPQRSPEKLREAPPPRVVAVVVVGIGIVVVAAGCVAMGIVTMNARR